MTPLQVLKILQTLFIILGTITCFIGTKRNYEQERRYILPYCAYSALAMCFLLSSEIINYPVSLIYTVMYIAGCLEILLIPNYISSIIGKIKTYHTQIIICSSTFILSILAVQTPTTLLYLFSNLYITYYTCQYFIWLFKTNEKLDLKATTHYWLIMGLCICFTGSIPYYLSELFILKFEGHEVYDKLVKSFHATFIILNITMYILFIKAFICKRKSQKSSFGQY